MRFADRHVLVMEKLVPGKALTEGKVADDIGVNRRVRDVANVEVVLIANSVVHSRKKIVSVVWLTHTKIGHAKLNRHAVDGLIRGGREHRIQRIDATEKG